MNQLDWDHLRHVLAVGTAGSLAGAARQLGVNHTTVLRRLEALEAHLGTRLFERARGGYEPTEAGWLLLSQARRMADQADAIERQVLGRDRELTGLLRVTTAFVGMSYLLPEPIAEFARRYPGIEVEVSENAVMVDLARRQADEAQGWVRRQADVALRLSGQVAEHLVGRQLGQAQFRVYAPRGAAHLPQTVVPLPELIAQAPWIAFERDNQARVYDRWMKQHLTHSRVVMRVDIFDATISMMRTGIGVGLLPTFVEPQHPELVAVSDEIPELATPVWLLTHPDLRRTARVQAFMQLVGDAVAQRLRAQR